ncbi:MAG: hypothetical protein AAGE83_02315 [Pseudomonadota bacterium]
MIPYLDAGAALLAFAAAVFWFKSSSVKIPPPPSLYGKGPDDDHPYMIAVRQATRFNRNAAIAAGLSALCACGAFALRAATG